MRKEVVSGRQRGRVPCPKRMESGVGILDHMHMVCLFALLTKEPISIVHVRSMDINECLQQATVR